MHSTNERDDDGRDRCRSCTRPFNTDGDRHPRWPGDVPCLCGACASRLRAAGSFADWLDAEWERDRAAMDVDDLPF
jgi:hypothetical protein